MKENIEELFELLFAKYNKVAYKALKELQKISEDSSEVYIFMDKFVEMLDNKNSYIRTRALTLIAYNAKWDKDNKIDEIIDRILLHIEDDKPITARKCIELLPMIAKAKPNLKSKIIHALNKADVSIFASSMQTLVYNDIRNSLKEIQEIL